MLICFSTCSACSLIPPIFAISPLRSASFNCTCSSPSFPVCSARAVINSVASNIARGLAWIPTAPRIDLG
jgi:hypothetical protein